VHNAYALLEAMQIVVRGTNAKFLALMFSLLMLGTQLHMLRVLV
jgi:hypothetical protein